MTEYHCHILPGIDDGAKDPEMSLGMAEMMYKQGVRTLVCTPHFYAHSEKSVERFLEKREAAFSKIKARLPFADVRLGAEVAIENGISELEGIEKLAISGTDLILLELPYRMYSPWMSEEIYSIAAAYHLRVILAHIHRYPELYSRADMETVLKTDAVFQINNEAFEHFFERRMVRKLIKEEYPLVFGSDAHNLDQRRPNWNVLTKKVPADLIAASDAVLQKHSRG